MLVVASVAAADAAAGDFERTVNLPGSAMDVRFHYGAPGPGATTLAGEGSLGTTLPGDGRLTVRLPASIGSNTVLGDTQVAAGYSLVRESDLLPKVSVLAELALPTAPGSRGAHPGMKATAEKKLAWGDLHAETELRTEGRQLARSYRTAVGARLHLRPTTTASFDLVTLRPSGRSLLPRDDQAQLGLCQELAPGTKLRLGVGAGVTGGQSSLRSTVGLDLRF
jgi:hypothetical protein